MGHPIQLLDAIAAAVATDYPKEDGYKLIYEKALPGTRIYPDIRVDDFAGKTVCVVEIGYTRGEKFTTYRERGIQDVRWYDKQGRLNTAHEEVSRHVAVSINVAPTHAFTVWSAMEMVECWCDEDTDAGSDDDEDEDKDDGALVADDMTEEERQEERCAGVLTYIVTDYARVLLASYCDRCEKAWVANPDDEGFYLFAYVDGLRPSEYAQQFTRVLRGTWSEAQGYVAQAINLELEYLDGHPFNSDLVRDSIDVELQRIKKAAMKEMARES